MQNKLFFTSRNQSDREKSEHYGSLIYFIQPAMKDYDKLGEEGLSAEETEKAAGIIDAAIVMLMIWMHDDGDTNEEIRDNLHKHGIRENFPNPAENLNAYKNREALQRVINFFLPEGLIYEQAQLENKVSLLAFCTLVAQEHEAMKSEARQVDQPKKPLTIPACELFSAATVGAVLGLGTVAGFYYAGHMTLCSGLVASLLYGAAMLMVSTLCFYIAIDSMRDAASAETLETASVSAFAGNLAFTCGSLMLAAFFGMMFHAVPLALGIAALTSTLVFILSFSQSVFCFDDRITVPENTSDSAQLLR